MKKNFLCFGLLTFCMNAFAQKNSYEGSWHGTLNVGIELRIVFHIKQENSVFISTADSPDQNAYGLICDTTIVSTDGIRIEMRKLNAIFSGRFTDDSTISGTFVQAKSSSLLLKKGAGTSAVRKRPQTPVSPFAYKSEEVEYDNADKTLRYGATITIPEGSGPFPAALLITGSGAQDRDEDIMGHKTFAVLADALTKNGFVVLRVDDRGVGKSSGNFADATSADFAIDAHTSLNYLLSRSEVNKKKTGMIGHSEGGLIAPIVATQRKDIDFLVLLAGPGVKITQLMSEQNAAILRSVGISEPAVNAYIPLYTKLMTIASTSPDSLTASTAATAAMQEWVVATDSGIVREIGFQSNEVRKTILTELLEGFAGKWFRYFLTFDPQPYLEKLNTKVLALNGEKDIQVIASSNLSGIESSLKKSKTKKYTVKTLQGLNHLFQTCKLCGIQEYGELEETFSPVALKEINDWLNKNVK